MKFKCFFALLLLAMPGIVNAIPANPRIRTISNPDGSQVEVRVHGDEFFHFFTDAACTRILERDSRGFLVDAVRDGSPLMFNKEGVLRLKSESADGEICPSLSSRKSMQKMASLNSEGRTTYPTLGKGNRSIVVLVEFQDVAFTIENPKEYYTRQLNEPGFSDYGGCGSALDHFKDASHGLYAPQFDVYGPVKISKNASYFKDSSSGNMALLINEALTMLHDSGEVDFSNYDLDDNGIVDTVFFYYAGYGQADSSTETIWPHQSDYQGFVNYNNATQLIFDNKKIGPYACGNELSGYNPQTQKQPWKDGSEPWVDGIGTFVHEYGHVLGLPDLYDVENAVNSDVVTPGDWDVMDTGSYNFNGATQSEVVTILHDTPKAAADGSNSFELEWDDVEAADSYLVTVVTATSRRVVNNLDNKNVGKVTKFNVSGISNTFWKLEMEAFTPYVGEGFCKKESDKPQRLPSRQTLTHTITPKTKSRRIQDSAAF